MDGQSPCRLRSGDQIVVPAHWPTEISNGMLMGLRWKRIQPAHPELFWDELAILPIEVEPSLSPGQAKIVLALCKQHGLTVYDAAYLELAKRKGLSLDTLDSALLKAAPQEAVALAAAVSTESVSIRAASLPLCFLAP